MLINASMPAAALLAVCLTSAVRAQDPGTPPAAPAGCIAIMAATVTGVEGNAAEAGTAVRDVFISFLSGPSMAPVALESRVRQLAVEEAREKNCAYMVTASLARKRSGGGGLAKALGHAAGTAAWYVPGSAAGGVIVRGLSVGAAQAVQDITSSTRAKDEMRLEWSLTALATQTSAANSNDKRKAVSDGEDLLTPLVQRAAESIVAVVFK